MSKFLKIPISPLMGSSLINYIKVILSNNVSSKYYLHVFLTFLVVLLISPFQLIDKIIFFFKRNNQKNSDPIFIVGHWRSGTTLLHNLLSLNKNIGFINTYNSLFINNIYTSFLFKTLMKITMPKERPSDKIKLDVDLPQEDEFAVSNYVNISHYNFFFFPNDYKKFYSESIRFDNNKSSMWLNAYCKLLKRVNLYTNKSKIIVKNPSNTARIKYLLKKYPNAKFIHIYRNPVYVYLSTFKFFSELFPSVNLQNIDDKLLHELIIYNYREMYKDYYEQKKLIPKENLIEIRFEDFKKDSLSYLNKIHKKFDLELSEDLLSEYKRYLNSQKSHIMNTYKIKKSILNEIKKEYSNSFIKMKYDIPKNLDIN